ncbi:hypothetical protein DSO57_1011718 [Entomophthora muscae]|uniref:Uncharacterized protein n=1 Tax=Entomophthora muscae TaxID=34485 RepID=A0ACC2T623_9FUNG|nr:hypothetical protein DSO57_1011718 [Entomophthora muscae]
MRQFFLLATTVLSLSDKELISDLYQLIRLDYPHHACAVFKGMPTISGKWKNHQETSWKVIHEDRSFFRDPIVGVCIPETLTGEWMRRSGDGGLENWRYDFTKFSRDANDLITVRYKKNLQK